MAQVKVYVPGCGRVATKVPSVLTSGWSAKDGVPVLITLWGPCTHTNVTEPPAAISTLAGRKMNLTVPSISIVACEGNDGPTVGVGVGGTGVGVGDAVSGVAVGVTVAITTLVGVSAIAGVDDDATVGVGDWATGLEVTVAELASVALGRPAVGDGFGASELLPHAINESPINTAPIAVRNLKTTPATRATTNQEDRASTRSSIVS